MIMTLDSQKGLFDIPDDITFLNCANMSPLLRNAKDAGIQAIIQRTHAWEITSADWFTNADKLRELFAQLISAHRENIALIPSVSYGIAIAANNIPLKRGQKIILINQQYSSNVYAWREAAKKSGAEIVTVTRENGQTWTDAILKQIDLATGLVAIPNCHWIDGSLLNLEEIGQEARRVNAALVIDASQSLGVYPLDISNVKPDFLVTVGYKWLLGPYGLGYLYADAKYFNGNPIEYSWLNKKNCRDFSLADYTDEYEPGARRFDMGEFASFIHIPMAIAALTQIHDWGIPSIRQTLMLLTEKVRTMASRTDMAPTQHEIAGHIIGLMLQPERAKELNDRLLKNKIYASIRGSFLRIAPHVYNSEMDIDRLFEIINTA